MTQQGSAATNDEWVDAVAVPPLPEWDPEEGVDVWFDLVPIEEAGDA